MDAFLKERTYCEGLAAVTQRFISFKIVAKPPLVLIPLPPSLPASLLHYNCTNSLVCLWS